MARPKEFDREEALGRAMEVFWTKGFEGTSLDDLTRATGVGRQSLYDTFGDKHALYLASLSRYCDNSGGEFLGRLASAAPLRATLRGIFDLVVQAAVTGSISRGCMLVDAVVAGEVEPDVRRAVQTAWATRTAAIARRLARARQDGELGQHQDPHALAEFFHSTIQGMIVVARASRDRKALEDIARTALSVLG